MAFGGGFDEQGKVMSEINMTPLVDVMLVLLIIFIITVPVLTHSVKVDLPRAENQANEEKPETIDLSITLDGSIYWNGQALAKPDFETRLAEVASRQPQPELHIRADRKVAYEQVAQAMAAAQRAGVQKLGFVTEPGS
ncbi:biopolymer transporter ExbD [Chitinimonas arctica]|uniref:Biopolymer transporter ExbD n=1 Tax=Chitinimonas arctica TaxID=2594795 RepID=A0A516SIK0_9NEIS|nr:biopolymer transporter ExbD [Chitinimonas arctica]QDQ27980.1 biopolymer transporter ExbD [Chitinimonas arctica]